MGLRDFFYEYRDRFLTAGVLLGVVLAVGLINSYFVTWLFLGVVYMLAFYEAMRLFDVDAPSVYVYAIILWLAAFFYPNPDDLFFIIALLFASILAYTHDFESKLFLPFLYPTSSFLFLLSLYHDFGMGAMFWLLVVVVLTDSGAFFVGKAIGRTPFCDTSPKKTLEGVVGGVAIATGVGFLIGGTLIDLQEAFFISLLVSIASVFGDLFESYLKRRAGVKDAGAILPGHGGVLDRVDSYLFGGIAMVILLRGLA